MPGDQLTMTTATTHDIELKPDAPIVNTRQYNRPRWEWEIIGEHVDKLKKEGAIVDSYSPYNSPVLVVPRKGPKRWRVVIDYRKINDLTAGDAYPLPNIDGILQQLGNTSYFSVIDMAEGFNQVAMTPGDEQKTAFSSPYGHYHYRVMPFGLKGAPARFQRLMDTVLIGLQGIKCFIYLDDLVVYGQTLKEHNEKLVEIFQRFRKYNLKVQTQKCHFLEDEIVYLGHTITKNGVLPNPEKIKVVENYPVPQTTKEVKQFVALCSYYRKFVKDFSKIAHPLTKLLKQDQKFEWTEFCQEAFQVLKEKLVTAPILSYPDYDKKFILTTDASLFAIGGVLSQGEIGSDKPVAYASRKLNTAEVNYSTIEKELLAVVEMCKHFRHFLYGRPFLIVTYHRPLVWLFNLKDTNSRLTKFRLKLEEYDYEIIYKPGKQNTNADALSRIPYPTEENYDTLVKQILKVKTRSETRRITFADPVMTENQEPERNEPESPIVIEGSVNEEKLDEEILENEPLAKNYENYVAYEPSTFVHIEENPSKLTLPNASDLTILIVPDIGSLHTDVIKKNELKPSDLLDLQNGELRMINDYLGILSSTLQISGIETEEEIFHHLLIIYEFYKRNNKYKNLRLGLTLPRPEDRMNLKLIIQYLFQNEATQVVLYTNEIIEIRSKFDMTEIIRNFHEAPLGGHQGMNRTLKRIQNYYTWTGMARDVEEFIARCSSCQRNKVSRINKIPMKITTSASKPMERVFLDIVGPLPITYNNNRYILTFEDDLTKFSEAIPLPDAEAETIAEAFVTKIICKFSAPQVILTDMGTNFLSKLFKAVCKLLSSKKINSSPYHPQTNPVERTHRGLKEYLRSYVDKDQLDWCTWLPYAMFVYNTSTHSSTNYTPFETLFGFIARMPTPLTQRLDKCYNYDNYVSLMKAKFQHSHKLARETMLSKKNKSKLYYDRNAKEVNYHVGDLVLLRKEARKNKLQEIWQGPYEILEIISPQNSRILLKKNRIQTVHNNRLKLYNEYTEH